MEHAEERYQTFTGLILSISRSIQRIKNAEMSFFGLKGKQVQCLFSLYTTPDGANLSQLAELCGEDRAALYRTVQELATRDLVFTDDTPGHKYKKLIKLTSKGQKMAGIVVTKIAEIVGLAGADLSDSARSTLYNSLTQIDTKLTEICQEYEK